MHIHILKSDQDLAPARIQIVNIFPLHYKILTDVTCESQINIITDDFSPLHRRQLVKLKHKHQ